VTAKLRLGAALAAVLLPTALSAETAPLAPIIETPQWMQALADDLFVPGSMQLARQARQLDQATRELCAKPNPTALTRAQASWRTVARSWRRLEALPIGPMLARRSLRRFDFWPTRPAQIEDAVADASASVAALQSIGVSAQGLPALEYLLFDAARPAVSSAAHCRYAVLLAQAFAGEAQALSTAWREWRAPWQGESIEPSRSKAALTDVLNATIGALETLRVRKLEKPAQPRGGREPLFDAWRSGATKDHLLATFDGLRVVLFGAKSSIGLAAMLRGYGHHQLAARLAEQAHAADAALRALPANLSTPAARPTIAAAVAAIADLQRTLSTEVAEVLRVTIGFNESDGD
jgi:hypothetical protein